MIEVVIGEEKKCWVVGWSVGLCIDRGWLRSRCGLL